MKSIESFDEYKNIIDKEAAVFAYFSHDKCSVCKTLKPKLSTAIKESFPNIRQVYINTEEQPEIAGQERIFTVPVIVIYFAGQESIRKARNIGVQELINEISRPYHLLFE